MAPKGAQVRKARDLSPHFHSASQSRAAVVKKWAPRLAYGLAASWYVRTGPTGTWQEKLVRRGAATAVGLGIFKGPSIFRKIRGDNKNGIHKSNINNTNRARRSSGTRRRSARK